MLSFLAREIKRLYPRKKVVIETEWTELFLHNPFVDKVIKGKKAKVFYFKPKYRLPSPDGTHMLHQLSRAIGIDSSKTAPFVELYLQDDEVESVRKLLPQRFVAVCPSGKMTFAGNRKEWGFDRFQQIVNSMKDIEFVQIGVPKDPLLDGVLDFRGLPVRTSAAILKLASAGLFIEGGLGHLARSVGRASVIIYGGALDPSHTGYSENINLATTMDCAPCFTSHAQMTDCDHKSCMESITPDRVVSALYQLMR